MNKNLFIKIGYNTLIQIIGKVGSALLGLLTVALLTRYLGSSGYGNFTLVFAYLSFFSVLADLGLQVVIVRDLHDGANHKEILGTFLWLKLVLIGISMLIAICSLFFSPYVFSQKIAILIGIAATSIGSLSGFGTAVFQSKLRLDLITITDILSRVVNTLLIIYFIYLQLNFYFIVSTVFWGNVIGCIAIFLLVQRMDALHFEFSKEKAKMLLRTAIPIGISLFFSTLYFKLDTVMLSIMKNSQEVGIYSLSYKILENILVVWSFYMATLYPILSKYKSQNSQKQYMNLLRISIIILCSTSLLLILIGYFFAPFFITILGGNNFIESIDPFKILLFSIPLFFATNLYYFINLINGKGKLLVYALSFSLIVNFALNLLVIPRWGYIGTSYTTIITEGCLLIFYILL